MTNIFYILSILFIFMNVYYIFKHNELDKRFEERDLMKLSKLDLVYYFTRFSYWIWIIVGLFSGQSFIFWILIGLASLKFPLYHINKNIFRVYNDVYPILCIASLITIFVYWI